MPIFSIRKSSISPYDQAEYELAEHIANITTSSDRIWTSEGAIVFFTQRQIIPPNQSKVFTELYIQKQSLH